MNIYSLLKNTPNDLLEGIDLKDVNEWRSSVNSFKSQANKLQIILFPEEGDLVYDSIKDAKDRGRGINPMNEKYQQRVDKRRAHWGIPPYSLTAIDDKLLDFCKNITKVEGNYVHYDFIGDVHGFATDLRLLLSKLGYVEKNGFYQAKNRKAFFVGDFVDRGEEIVATLEIVKAMCENGSAKAVMGNHEFNWIMFNTIGYNGKPIREHSDAKLTQNKDTREQFDLISQNKKDALNNWMMNLPFWIEEDEFRVVHACWESDSIERIEKIFPEGKFSTNKDVKYLSHKFDDTNAQLKNKALTLYNDLSKILTGIEEKLPGNLYFLDSYKHKRFEVRLKWWNLNKNKNLKDVIFNFDDIHGKENLSNLSLNNQEFQTTSSKPVFIGHYWLTGKPEVMSSSVVCIDYSIAKGGKLVAYSSGDFSKLSNNNFTM
jgi:hypothetical protein